MPPLVIRADADSRQAPREAQLWNPGANPTDFGIHVWSERSIREVLARYTARGNPILVDVEHNGSQLEDGAPAATAGYARLEVRAGAPWLVFDWSDFGRAQIESGQRRYLSAEYDVDKDTGEILALYRVSLVADPGTHRARMLADARGGTMPADSPNSSRVGEDAPPSPQTTTEGNAGDAAAATTARRLTNQLEVPGPVALWLAQNIGANVLARMIDELAAATARAAASRSVTQAFRDYARALRASPPNAHGLSARELQKCKAKGIDPEKYAATKRLMGGR